MGRYGCELSPLLNNHLVEPRSLHLTDRTLELLAPLGIRAPQVRWRFPIDASSRKQARETVARLGLLSDYAVINPGASWPSKLWEMDRFAKVAIYLAQQHSLQTLVVWGGAQERAFAEQIVAGSRGCATLAPATNLGQLGALIEGSRLFLSADTGPMHLAVAVGTPTLSLHGVTRPEESGPYGPPHASILVRYHTLSRKQRKRVDNRAMRLITARMVCDRCSQLLKQTGRRGENAA